MVETERQTLQLVGKLPDIVVVPVGVGSLAQAVVSYFKSMETTCGILTVEPETAACLKTSLGRGEITTISTEDTSMCGMNCGTVSSTAWPLLKHGVDASTTVSDTEAEIARRLLAENGFQVGPCSAATLAAVSKVSRSDIAKYALNLTGESVIMLLATEGPRRSRLPAKYDK